MQRGFVRAIRAIGAHSEHVCFRDILLKDSSFRKMGIGVLDDIGGL